MKTTRWTTDKVTKLLEIADRLTKDEDEKTSSHGKIIHKLLVHIDVLQDELKYLEEQVEFMEGELQDKKREGKSYKRKKPFTERF